MTDFNFFMMMLLFRSLLIFVCSFWLLDSAIAYDDYRLGAGDVIKITVFESPGNNTEERISESGNISLPIIGRLEISGLSTEQAADLISHQFEKAGLIKQAHVSVMVVQFMSRQVSVIGHVNKPGKYVLDKNSSIVELLAMAGGIDNTGEDKAILLRSTQSAETKLELDLNEIFKQGVSKNIEVINGDIIFVPPADMFYIYGEVQKPGMIRLERNMTVLQAISAAGGLTVKGAESNVVLKRSNERGDVQEIDVGLGEKVKPDDILFIPESWF